MSDWRIWLEGERMFAAYAWRRSDGANNVWWTTTHVGGTRVHVDMRLAWGAVKVAAELGQLEKAQHDLGGRVFTRKLGIGWKPFLPPPSDQKRQELYTTIGGQHGG